MKYTNILRWVCDNANQLHKSYQLIGRPEDFIIYLANQKHCKDNTTTEIDWVKFKKSSFDWLLMIISCH